MAIIFFIQPLKIKLLGLIILTVLSGSPANVTQNSVPILTLPPISSEACKNIMLDLFFFGQKKKRMG